jgi:hypothetical protein
MKRELEAIYRARKEAGQEAGQEGVQDNLRDKTAYCLSCYQLRPQQLFKGFYTCELCRKKIKRLKKHAIKGGRNIRCLGSKGV